MKQICIIQVNLSSLKFFLLPLSITYEAIVYIRNLLYNLNILKKKKLKCPVISIGNITVGGTGKTPTVILIANELIKRNLKVGILTRGYGRKLKKTIIICNDGRKKEPTLNANETGDEPLLLYQKLPNTPIAISRNRYESGKILLKTYSLDLIILDDGFQHRSIHRNLDIVLINSLDKKNKYKILPTGFLREPLKNLQRADFILFTKSNLIEENESPLIKVVKNFNIPYSLSTAHNRLTNYIQDQQKILYFLDRNKGYLVSGIGDASSFKLTASVIAKNIIGYSNLRDHYNYKQSDLNKIIKKSGKISADYILTTEKDWVKLKHLESSIPIFPVELIFKLVRDKSKLFNLIYNKLNLRHPISENNSYKSEHKRPSRIY
tara:strand:- start:169 stop:1302 length:1134 start_codon:yes stop_codon:yes gene_type:complete